MFTLQEFYRATIAAGVLAVFVSVIAYVHSPRLKLLVLCVPVPFVCAYLFSGMPINSTHVTGMAVLIGYHWFVYFARERVGLPLGVTIPLGAVGYILVASTLRPMAQTPFAYTLMAVLPLWLLISIVYHPIVEPGHRSTAPVYIKAPSIFFIALVIYSLTGALAGAVTTFPYAGVFTSYEMRKSLKTLAGQYTINSIAFFAMFLVMWLTQERWPAPWPLVLGVVTVIVTVLTIHGAGWGEPVVEGRT